MASTYVNNLRLNEMATGDGAGTWGTTTNTNLELIGEALGYGTEAITTNADTHTSTVADGSADAARAMYLKYTGTLDSACTITIGPNTMKRVQFIENATTGSQNIIISQGSGANVTIPPGDVKVVYLDGAGSGAAVTDAFASLSVVDLKVQDDLTVTDDLIVNGDIDLEGNMDVNGTLETDALSLNGTTVTSTAAEINLLDGSSANTVVNSKAVIYGSSGEVAGTLSTAAQTNITSVGALDGGSITSGFGSIDVGSSAITTTGTVTGNTLAGTLSTAAQPNITSLGTLTTLTVDDITINGSTISDAGDLTLDVGGDIILDADGGDWKFQDAGTSILEIQNDGNGNAVIIPTVADKDIKFLGNDGGSTITALTLDMSDAGAATFNGHGTFNDTVAINSTSSGALTIAGTGGGLNFTGGNNRINFNSNRALEGATDGSTLTIGEDYTTIRLSGAVVANESGADADFRVESDSKSHMLFVDAGNNKVGINQASPAAMIDIVTVDTAGADALRIRQPDSSDIFQIQAGISGATNDGLFLNNTNTTGQLQGWKNFEINFNDDGVDRDFRVESNGNTHMLFVDAGNDRVGINDDSPISLLGLKGTANTDDCKIYMREDANNGAFIKYDGATNEGELGGLTSASENTIMTWSRSGDKVVFNENSLDMDFRVESNGNANMLFVDGGNNEIGVGTNAPDTILHVHKGSAGSVTALSDSTLVLENSTHNYLTFLSPNDKENAIIFGDADNNNNASVGYNHNTDNLSISAVDDIVFNTSGTTRGRFTDNGLCFNADTAAANALDDYEEGTWTPGTGPGSSQGYAFRSGHYTKVGRLVTAHFGLKHNAGTFTSGEANLTGLPFAVISTGSFQEPMIILTTIGNAPTSVGGSGASGALIPGEASFYLAGGESQGRGRKFTTNADTVMDANEIFDSDSFIKGTVIYYTT